MDIHLICTIKNNRTVLTPEDKLRLFCRMLALDNTFLTLQTVLEQAMLRGGDNDYKIPHLNKRQMRKQGTLPPLFECSVAAVEVCDDC